MVQSRTELLIALLPWLWLGLGLLVCLCSLGSDRLASLTRPVAIAASLLAVGSAFAEIYRGRFVTSGVFVAAGRGTSHLAPGSLIIDAFALTVVIALGAFATAALVMGDGALANLGKRSGLACALVLAAEGFGDLLAAQHEMATLVLGIGGLSLCTSGLVACFKTGHSVEVAAKWLASAMVLTALMALGLALLYGATSSTAFAISGNGVTLAIGATLVVISLAAFCGALPLPQPFVSVAQGVPAAIAGWLLTVNMVAVIAALTRIGAAGLGRDVHGWAGVLGLAGGLSVAYGGVRAWGENSIRRMVGYLVVAQTGCILVALMAFGRGSDGLPAGGIDLSVASMIAAGMVITTTFAVITMLETAGIGNEVADLRALLHRNGVLGVFLIVCLLSLAGAPATAGFAFRFLGFVSATYVDKLPIGLLAFAGSALCTFAVLRVVYLVCAAPTYQTARARAAASVPSRVVLAALSISVLVLGVLPGPLLQLGAEASRAILTR